MWQESLALKAKYADYKSKGKQSFGLVVDDLYSQKQVREIFVMPWEDRIE
jgi:hypothetical protein